MAKKVTTKKKATKKKAAAKIEVKPVQEIEIEDIIDEIEAIFVQMPATYVGERVSGDLYMTTHQCNHCEAEVVTVGAGHPSLNCSRCGTKMSTSRIKQEG